MFDRIYAVYDLKSEALAGRMLHLSPADGAACRDFTDLLLRSPDTAIGQHPEDYNLVCLGHFERAEDGRLMIAPEVEPVQGIPVPHRVVLCGADVVRTERTRLTAQRLERDLEDAEEERLQAGEMVQA